MDEFWDLMDEYRAKFDDQFPLYAMPDAPDDEIKALIKKSLSSGKPYEYGKDGENY